jgi:hypothetical protein
MNQVLSKKTMIILLSILSILILAFLAGKWNLSKQFAREVEDLFADSKFIREKRLSYKQLSTLPVPVQRYFKLVLNDGQAYISYARITHDGQFKTGLDKDWVNIKGEQYATTEKPGFIWKGVTSLFTARDMYIWNQGRLVVSLLGILKIVDGKGEHFNQGELLRWLGESVLYPTNLLPSENLVWSAVDNHSAKFTFRHAGFSLSYLVTFNDVGEIVQLETKRYMDLDHLETWIIKAADYKKMNNILVPSHCEVFWRLKTGDFSYAKFNITKVEYDNPSRF